MDRMLTVTIKRTNERVIMVLRSADTTGEREYTMTEEHALQLSLALETAVEQMQHERFMKLPMKQLDVKSGSH